MQTNFVPGVNECPHCFSRVIILSDGICPNCRGDASNSATADPELIAEWIHSNDRIPDVCITCATRTEQRIRVQHEDTWQAVDDKSSFVMRNFGKIAMFGGYAFLFIVTNPANAIGIGLLGVFVWVVWLVSRQTLAGNAFSGKQGSGRQADCITLSLPECDNCRRGPVSPVTADHRTSALRMVIHKNFRTELIRLNPGAAEKQS